MSTPRNIGSVLETMVVNMAEEQKREKKSGFDGGLFDQNCGPDCPLCKGSRYIRRDLPLDHPQFGKVETCPLYQRDLMTSEKHYDSRVGVSLEEIRELTWALILPNISDGDKALDVVKPAFERGHGFIFLWGEYGQAKSLIMKIAAAMALKCGMTAAYSNLSRILDDIRLAYDAPEHKTKALLKRMDYWAKKRVLCVDEIDKANETEWAEERIHCLIDTRYQMAVRETGLTIMSSNKASGQLDGYLNSRITDSRFSSVRLSGPDGRKSVPKGWRF